VIIILIIPNIINLENQPTGVLKTAHMVRIAGQSDSSATCDREFLNFQGMDREKTAV
jgi:hypothetical protein